MSKEVELSSEEYAQVLDCEINLPEKDVKKLCDLINEGPIIINFIVGSWCPMCLEHINVMTTILKNTNFKIIIISSETQGKLDTEFEKLSPWAGMDRERLIFHSDSSRRLINLFKLKIPVFGFSKPATYLLQKNQPVKVLTRGIPNNSKTVCELSHYLSKVPA